MKFGSRQKQQVILIIMVVIFFFVLLGLNARLTEFFRLTNQHEVMQTRIAGLKATQVGLQTQISYASSDKAAEEWARIYGHEVLPGDQVIIPLPMSGTQQTINFLPTLTTKNNEKWSVWWELFFGE
jgi:hypothetical protein